MEFWIKMMKMKNFNGEIVFPNLAKLVRTLFALLHANANAERIFFFDNNRCAYKKEKYSKTCNFEFNMYNSIFTAKF